MKVRRTLFYVLIGCTFVAFFCWAAFNDSETSKRFCEEYMNEEFSEKILLVEYKNHGYQIELVTGERISMGRIFMFKNGRQSHVRSLSDVLKKGDHIIKKKGSHAIHVDPLVGDDFEIYGMCN